MNITSVFENGKPIPSTYTCDGADAIVPLEIFDVPSTAKSLALIFDDPDAPRGTWDHWVLWNIPPTTKKINRQMGVAGTNSWGRLTYGGPCPPSGTHRYYFKLYALDTLLSLKEGSTKKELETAIKGHIISEAVLMGTYQRT